MFCSQGLNILCKIPYDPLSIHSRMDIWKYYPKDPSELKLKQLLYLLTIELSSDIVALRDTVSSIIIPVTRVSMVGG